MKLDPNGLPKIQYAVKLSNYKVAIITIEVTLACLLFGGLDLLFTNNALHTSIDKNNWQIVVYIAIFLILIFALVRLIGLKRKIETLIEKSRHQQITSADQVRGSQSPH